MGMDHPDEHGFEGNEIAIIGMAGRFPKARNLDEFWQNLVDGVEAITFFSDEEVRAAGVGAKLVKDPHYVKAGGVLEDVDQFDASFFGFYPREAAIMDPQHRVFLECAWEALENAGYDPDRYPGWIGLFAGTSMNTYLIFNLIANHEILETVHGYQLTIANDKDFLPTRVSYKFNLRGPSVNVQTACSTSLVAVHLACQSLINYQTDMAMAGGVSIRFPQKQGYLYQEGGIASPDGHCRPFDAGAAGTVGGSGVGVVVLKRLSDALAEGDSIRAIIRGSSINNDGSLKVGYTAPSVDGQAQVIATAQAVANVEPETITYVETHGTGTKLGDPIEIEALTQVFRGSTEEKGFCAIGSVKANIGHLDAAAGVTSLIKTALALEKRQIPPNINYTRPNPAIDFANSPFFVNRALTDWETDGGPRRAGVSSFGIGGTNAHVVMEEAPELSESEPGRAWQLLLLSARTPTALDRLTGNLADYLRQNPDISLADAAFTLQTGRKQLEHRRAVLVRDLQDSILALDGSQPQRLLTGKATEGRRPVVFMFTGQGAQYANMTRDLYEQETVFREAVDECAEGLKSALGQDIRRLLFPAGIDQKSLDEAQETLRQTATTQPALFVVEYALARLLQSWGIEPQAMIGHSIGEYVAACLAGVFSLRAALMLVAARGRLMGSLPPGGMVSVQLSEEKARVYCTQDIHLAAVNAPDLCVLSGPLPAVASLETRLAEEGVEIRRLHTSHAFHSAMMDPILDLFLGHISRLELKPPKIPFISNITGTWITAEQAVDPAYWANHLRQGVRFSDGIEELAKDRRRIFLEVGPGRTLVTLARSHPATGLDRPVITTVRHPQDSQDDLAFLLTSLGRLWMAGVEVDWTGFYNTEQRRRIPLPVYPFERQRYWIEPDGPLTMVRAPSKELQKRPDIESWFYTPSWKRIVEPSLPTISGRDCWLILGSDLFIGSALASRLEAAGQDVIRVSVGAAFTQADPGTFTINPAERAGYHSLLNALKGQGKKPDHILHLEPLRLDGSESEETAAGDAGLDRSFYSLLYLVQALGAEGMTHPLELSVVTSGAHAVTGEEGLDLPASLVSGLGKVIPQEYPNIHLRTLDLPAGSQFPERILDSLFKDSSSAPKEAVIAYRGLHRWTQVFEPVPAGEAHRSPLREAGVYLITGGLGRIGLHLAEYLALTVHARLVLVDRLALPAPSEWDDWRDNHPGGDPTGQMIRRLQGLEALGAEIMLAAADVSDQPAMQQVVTAALDRFGTLHGVVHAAGLVGERSIRSISELKDQDCEAQFGPKVRGLRVLDRVLQESHLSLDFIFLQSSLSAVLGGLGLAAYASANAFMDGLAAAGHLQKGLPYITVDWDGWQFGEAGATSLAELSMTPEEGVAAFAQALALGLPHLVISTADLQARYQKWVQHRPGKTAAEDQPTEKSSLFPRPSLQTPYLAPRSELEEGLAAMWQNVLGIDQVGVQDDFFELGGHSLLATQLVSRVRDTYQVEFPLRRLFETPTIAGLATLIQEAQALVVSEGKQSAPVITPVSRQGDLPLSFGQQRLWFLDQLEPNSPLYNNFAAVRLEGELDRAALEASVQEIVRRHESLRTTFSEVSGKPVQVIAGQLRLSISEVDLREYAGEAQEQAVRQLAWAESRQPFSLSHGPLLRITLLALSASEHIVFLTMHHIISDGWSVAVLINELGSLYPAFLAGRPSPLPEPAIQYADWAIWQQAWMQGSVLEDQLAYWKEQLQSAQSSLDLPTDHPRPAVQSWRGESQWFDLPKDVSAGLSVVSQQEGATLFMTLLAAFTTLLYRYSGQEDISIGTPIANRNRAESEGIIGFILNTLVMRSHLVGNLSFRELLARVRATALGAYAHQDLPFEMLVETLQPDRDMSRSPFFQVMFDLQVAALPSLSLPGLKITPLRVDSGTAKFDLALSMEESGGRLYGYLNYNRDLFEPERIAQMLHHFQALLAAVVRQPETALDELPLLSDDERRTLLEGFQPEHIDLGPYRSIQAVIEAQAASRAGVTSVRLLDQRFTYAEFNQRANQLAHYLRGLGVRPDVIVALAIERSLDAMVAILAIVKSGGAYLPLDPTAPRDRLAFMLQDAGAAVLLTQETYANQARDLFQEAVALKVVCLDADWPAIDAQTRSLAGQNPEPLAGPDDPAYVIYTSGSTGKPKGVQISNRAISGHLRVVSRHFALSPDDQVLQFSAFSFDQSIEQILSTWMIGATLVLRGPEIWDPAQFSQVIAEYGLTVVNIQPAYWRQWSQAAARSAEPENRQLRLVIIGGDVVLPEDVRLWWQTPMRSVRLLNAYGPTETTITASTFQVPTPDMGEIYFHRVPIGRPLADRRFYVLDPHGGLSPVGVPGELSIGGDFLAEGYLNRPELTAEKFLPDPFWKGKLYRTGDLVRWLSDGNLEFLGRVDTQVKLRGFRIELGEIETLLAAHPLVGEAVVIVRSDSSGDARLVAFITPRKGVEISQGDLTPANLRRYLADQLPAYMLPAGFAVLDALPLLASGKVDRRALPEPEAVREPDKVYIAPRTPVEEDLAQIWRDVLHIEKIGVFDNFFKLGGHSLLATQIVARVRETYRIDLPLRNLFEAPTIAGLADTIAHSLIEQESEEDIDQLLNELEQLSDEEVKRLLGEDQ